jgi:hypothetical protein
MFAFCSFSFSAWYIISVLCPWWRMLLPGVYYYILHHIKDTIEDKPYETNQGAYHYFLTDLASPLSSGRD